MDETEVKVVGTFLTGAGDVLGTSQVPRALPFIPDLKNQGQQLGILLLKGCLPLVWAMAFFSHLFSHKALSRLRFLYFKPATAGQVGNTRQQGNSAVISLQLFRGNRVPDELLSTDTFRAKHSACFRPLDLTP